MKTINILAITILASCLIDCTGQKVFAGSLIGWGWNENGQTNVPAGNDFVNIAAGWEHSLGLKSDGSIVGWGSCGSPPAGNDFVAIDAGRWYSLALKSDGSIAGWGTCPSPPAGNDFVAIAAGGFHGLALKSDGSIVGWGNNDYGQATPPAGNDFVAIDGGIYHSLALKSDGSLVAWGWNGYGQCNVPDGNDFVAIAAGAHYNVALKSDGSIIGWGMNIHSEINVPAGNDFIAIAAGSNHGLALKSDGSIAGWGNNGDGQATPPAGNNFVSIAAGAGHSLAIVAAPFGTKFTYQGQLIDDNRAANGLYDFEFRLYNNRIAGVQKGSTIAINDLDVIDGYFTLELDFSDDDPNVFNGEARWLEIGVRSGELEDPNIYTTLILRQEITPTPYALYARNTENDNDWMISADNIYSIPSGNVGIGTTSPNSKLEVDGTIHSTSGGFKFPDATTQTTAADGHSLDAADGSPADAVFVDNDGKVGIGTVSPAVTLDVNGYARATRFQDGDDPNYYVDPAREPAAAVLKGSVGIRGKPYSGGTDNPDLHINTGQDSALVWLGGNQTTTGAELAHLAFTGYSTATGNGPAYYAGIAAKIVSSGSGMVPPKGTLLFYTATGVSPPGVGYAEQMRVTPTGEVGIGTDNPTQAKLVVWPAAEQGGIFIHSTSYSEIEMSSGTANIYSNGPLYFGSKTENDLYFVTRGPAETRMTIKANGNVGIGTTSPARILHVRDVMRLEPRYSAPSSPSEGDMYMNKSTHKLMVYDGATWQACW